MKEIYERVAIWNNLRYEQEYNYDLAFSLLTEEYTEWRAATTVVDKLDALCDIAYVAYGVLWKLGITEEDFDRLLHSAIDTVSYLAEVEISEIAHFIQAMLQDLLDYPHSSCLLIIQLANAQMMDMGLSPQQIEQAMHIVCDSNDSKQVQKTDSTVKANIDKGANFIPPEPRLLELLECVKS